MDENKKVTVINATNHGVSISLPDLHLSRTWPKRNAKVVIPFNVLEEAIYEPGVERLFRNGSLYIDDMEVKKALGLEPEDTEEPTNVILTDIQIKRLMTTAPSMELREILPKLASSQIQNLVDYAINNELIDGEKITILKPYTNTNILEAINLKRKAEEKIDE